MLRGHLSRSVWRKPILTPHQMTEARKRLAKGEPTRDLASRGDLEADRTPLPLGA